MFLFNYLVNYMIVCFSVNWLKIKDFIMHVILFLNYLGIYQINDILFLVDGTEYD